MNSNEEKDNYLECRRSINTILNLNKDKYDYCRERKVIQNLTGDDQLLFQGVSENDNIYISKRKIMIGTKSYYEYKLNDKENNINYFEKLIKEIDFSLKYYLKVITVNGKCEYVYIPYNTYESEMKKAYEGTGILHCIQNGCDFDIMISKIDSIFHNYDLYNIN